MQPQPRRIHRRWRRFVRSNRGLFFLSFILLFVLVIVAALFWYMSDTRFIKPH